MHEQIAAVQADHEWRMCGSKVAYGSPEEARAAIRSLRSKWRKPLRAYRCPICSLFHLTSQPEER